jgi:sirohydrochlorin cobaltochelatase
MNYVSSKPVIIIAAHGTISKTGQPDLENLDSMVLARYPGYDVRWVFIYEESMKELIASGQTTLFKRKVPIKSLSEVYTDLRNEGRRDVVVQFLLVIPAVDYSDALNVATDGLNVEYGHPLLAPPENIARTVKALAPSFGGEDTVTILCCHGNEDVPGFNAPLILLDRYLRKHYRHVYLTTLEGPPGTEQAFADARKSGLKKVKFIPYLIQAGRHMSKDIMGDSPKSYKRQLGLPATSESGLASNPAVMSIWMESLEWNLAKFSTLTPPATPPAVRLPAAR